MIKETPYSEILKIRQLVLYPSQTKEFCILDDDHMGLHIGYYVTDQPVSVASLFLKDGELQIRKFATMPSYQNKGYGSKLLKWILDYAKDMQFNRIWCNARTGKLGFYKKFGFVETNHTYMSNNIQFRVIELVPR